MYNTGMRTKKKTESLELKEAIAPYQIDLETPMVRTQIYLTRAEHTFLQREAERQEQPMSAVIRSIIDEKMTLPDEVWTKNPLLEPTSLDPEYEGHEDSSLNHDHYAYGAPKKYGKKGGKWVLLPVKDE
jgi:hypothetical protein